MKVHFCPHCGEILEGNEENFNAVVSYTAKVYVENGTVFSGDLIEAYNEAVDEPYYHENCGKVFAEFREEEVKVEKLKKDPVEADKVYVTNLFGDEEKVYTLKENSSAVETETVIKKT